MLEGSLDTFPLPAVVRLLRDASATGRLAIEATTGTSALVFDAGRLVDAQGRAGDPLESALESFDLTLGTFRFREESAGERRLDLDVPDLLELVDERRVAWQRIRELIPPDEAISVAPLAPPEGELSPEAWRVVVLAGGRRPIELAVAAGMSEFEACSLLLELVESGLLELSTRQSPSVTPDQETRKGHHAEGTPAVKIRRLARARDEGDLDPSVLLRELSEGSPA